MLHPPCAAMVAFLKVLRRVCMWALMLIADRVLAI